MSQPGNLNTLLNTIAKDHNYNKYEIHIKEILSGGANYTSRLYKITITERDKDDLNLFAKVACMSEKSRKAFDNGKIYNNERFFYTTLVNVYKRLQDEYHVADEDRLTYTTFYGHDSTVNNETIVLEDLVSKGWSSYDRFKSVDWPYAAAAIRQLAKMHALSFAFRNNMPEQYYKVVENLKFNVSNEILDSIAGNGLTIALKNIDNMHCKKSLQSYVNEYSLNGYYGGSDQTAITHMDYRPSNLMHRLRQDGTVEIKIVDLQTMQGNSPVVDLLYFIFTGSDEEFRKNYYDKLIDYYYEQLEASMKRLHLNPDKVYSRADFDYELKEKLPFGLTIAVFALPIVTVEAKNAPKVDENMELTAFSVENTSDLYKERLNGVVNDFVKWGILK